MEDNILENQLFEILYNKDMPEHIKLAKVDMLISLGVDVNAMYGIYSALHIAKKEKLEKVAEFLSDNNAKDLVDEKNRNEYGKKLMDACAKPKSNIEEIKTLINMGADINYKNDLGMTAMMRASHMNNGDVVDFLISNGADIDAQDKDGFTALAVAVRYDSVSVAKILLDKGAKLDVKINNNKGKTLLITAAEWAAPEIVDMLIKYGEKVNVADDEGNTALMFASKRGSPTIIKTLVMNKADVYKKNKSGETAIDLAYDDNIKWVIIEEVTNRNKLSKDAFMKKVKDVFSIR